VLLISGDHESTARRGEHRTGLSVGTGNPIRVALTMNGLLPAIVVCRSRPSVASTTFTIVVSRIDVIPATITTALTHQTCAGDSFDGLGAGGGQRLGDVLELDPSGLDAEEQLGDAAERRYRGADEEPLATCPFSPVAIRCPNSSGPVIPPTAVPIA
jgi:hypothetical protein